MSGIGSRLAAWFANEVLAKTLSQSQGFRKVVMRTHETVEKVKGKAVELTESEAAKNLVNTAKTKVVETQKGGATVFDKMRATIRKLEEEGQQLNNKNK